MRRGFKAEAKRLALELRQELGLNAHTPFDPYAFAEEYGIRVIRLSELRGPARDHFLKADGSALFWSTHSGIHRCCHSRKRCTTFGP